VGEGHFPSADLAKEEADATPAFADLAGEKAADGLAAQGAGGAGEDGGLPDPRRAGEEERGGVHRRQGTPLRPAGASLGASPARSESPHIRNAPYAYVRILTLRTYAIS
jgi:hypothetical protein